MSVRNRVSIIFCILLAFELTVLADDFPSVALPSRSEHAALLFRSGRALEGHISETETHYVIERSGGRVAVPKTDVEFVGADFEAVYWHKSRTIDDQDPEAHIRLAQWCWFVNLHDQATEELERAIQLAPGSKRAQGLLEAFQRTARTAAKNSTQPVVMAAKAETEPSSGMQTAFQREVPSSLISTFSVQVQPMLTRSCATAGCHDSAHTGPLSLQRSPRPVAKLTQQNLRSVLAQVNADEPDSSPLLAYSIRPHGKLSASPLPKGVSDPAFVTLVEWVRAVSGKSPARMTEPDRMREEPTADPPNAPTIASKPTVEPVNNSLSSNLEREIGQVRAKLEDLAGSGRAYSNKPIAPTPSRIRAGMVQPAPASPSPAATTMAPEAPLRSAPRPGLANNPTIHETNSPRESGSLAPAEPTAMQPPVKIPSPNPPSSYQGVDPFDPEIFNRRFAPARSNARP